VSVLIVREYEKQQQPKTKFITTAEKLTTLFGDSNGRSFGDFGKLTRIRKFQPVTINMSTVDMDIPI